MNHIIAIFHSCHVKSNEWIYLRNLLILNVNLSLYSKEIFVGV